MVRKCEVGKDAIGAVKSVNVRRSAELSPHLSTNIRVTPFELSHTDELTGFEVVLLQRQSAFQELDSELKVRLPQQDMSFLYIVSGGITTVTVQSNSTYQSAQQRLA